MLSPTLDSTDLDIIILLQEKPLANYTVIAKLLQLSSPTIKRRLDRLYENKIIERIIAIPRYNILGLTTISCFFSIKETNINTMINLLQKHPYLYFYQISYGFFNGIHATFRLPAEAISSLEKLFKKLKEAVIIDFVLVKHPTGTTLRTTPRFAAFNSKNSTWDFNWHHWISTPATKIARIDNSEDKIKEGKKIILKELEYLDIEILSALSANSRQKNVDILSQLSEELSPQRLSEKLRDLRTKCISNYRVYLNWNVFDFVQVVFDCKTTLENMKFFKNLLYSFPPPFQTTFREYKEEKGTKTNYGFYWYLNCPPSHLLAACNAVTRICDDMRFCLLDAQLQYRKSLNVKTLDKEKMEWIIDEKFLVDNLLK